MTGFSFFTNASSINYNNEILNKTKKNRFYIEHVSKAHFLEGYIFFIHQLIDKKKKKNEMKTKKKHEKFKRTNFCTYVFCTN